MPESISTRSLKKIHLIEKKPLENNAQQWLLKTDDAIEVTPGTTLLLEDLKLPVLWQMGANRLLCLYRKGSKTPDKMHWQDYSFRCSPVNQQGSKKDSGLTLVLCKKEGFYHALHQIYNWRQQKQLPENLLVLSETQANLPFKLQPSKFFSPLVPAEATATIALLDDWGITARFVSKHWQPGCFEGTIKELERFIMNTQKTAAVCKYYFT